MSVETEETVRTLGHLNHSLEVSILFLKIVERPSITGLPCYASHLST